MIIGLINFQSPTEPDYYMSSYSEFLGSGGFDGLTHRLVQELWSVQEFEHNEDIGRLVSYARDGHNEE